MVNLFKPCILGIILLGGDNLYPIEFLLDGELCIILLYVSFSSSKCIHPTTGVNIWYQSFCSVYG